MSGSRVYGREGNRNDNIHTRQCSYEPASGGIRCQGEVQIDMQGASPTRGKPAGQPMQVKTSDLTFNRETGEAPRRLRSSSAFLKGTATEWE